MRELTVTTYQPDETRYWSTRELAALIDKRVAISFRPDDRPEVRLVTDAGIGRFGQVWVEFDKGSVAWSRDEVSASITVED
jgi:hypothetical protein